MQTVQKSPGITAKDIGRQVRLSAYSSFVYALKLVEMDLLTTKEAMFSDGRKRPIYQFYAVQKEIPML
ncbi:hypothetical protein [Scytonema sp. NUACC26]|uniref:hypothetical protein n=1 Tax=Scytonema sp. NUACC26 TaxID=3140176 RepID=UPI0034DBCB62